MNKNSKRTMQSREKIFEYESVDLTKTFPEWKSPLLSVNYMFIHAYHEFIKAKKKLDEKNKEIEFHRTEMTNKWIELRKKQEDFLNDVGSYNEFFMENENKCRRVRNKVITEAEFQKKYEQDIFNVKKRIECLEQLESDLNHWVHSLQSYHDYLMNITNKIGRFTDVSDLINYYILLHSETKTLGMFIDNLLESERSQNQLLKSLKVKMNLLNQQRSKLLEFKKDYQNKIHDLNEYAEKLNMKKSQANVSLSENINMEQACDNIFQKLYKWKKKHFSEISNDEKLIFIENSVDELKETVQQAYELSYKENISNKTDSSFITQKRVI